MIPSWLHVLAILSLAVSVGCAVWIAVDETGRPQHMWIMNVVWPATALFGGVLALAGYLAYGRGAAKGATTPEPAGHGAPSEASETPFAVKVGKGVTHCGSGCTLGDIFAEWLAFLVPGVAVAFGWHTIFADKMFAVWVLDYVVAFLIGIAFQYFTIAPMRGLLVKDGIVAAVKADALSLTAWQIGMYGFMAIAHFWIFGRLLGAELAVPTPEFWFMMQIAMLCGFVTAYPVNWWLIRRGIKEAM
ncbi:DUF4396 domain-containing protein [Acuticoccus mangrovi]|uniref:DUF4396 domain-containing protein n=1 Tax=Acuticoccus mangrovi TaxID=2796142 RepID=A0A934IRL7_9HYPH|nr:DUF4396 domain-containing protein [Acuticoccus mangrovi]MBJ3776977.1 DUF4396 domain-containing protein [Acuticoccus mangrovi]